MGSTSGTEPVQRKPIPHPPKNDCYCNHSAEVHGRDGKVCQYCKCEQYQRRPCVCGHAASHHAGRCMDRGCKCRSFRMDTSPAALLKMGLRAGDWQFISRPALQALQRPEGNTVDMRVWSTGMLHTQGRRRLAIKVDKGGRLSPLQPDDILQELNELDAVARLDRHAVRKAIRRLEQRGIGRHVPGSRKNTALYFYARPLKRRSLPDLPDPVLGVESDPQTPASNSFDEYLQEALILPARKSLVKIFRRTLREEIKKLADLGVEFDPQILIEKAVDELLLGVRSAYQTISLGVRNGGVYKEASRSSSKSSSEASAEVPTKPTTPLFNSSLSPTDPTERQRDWIREAAEPFVRKPYYLDDYAIEQIVRGCRANVADITDGEILEVLRRKGSGAEKAKSPVGFLVKVIPNHAAEIVAQLRAVAQEPEKPVLTPDQLRVEQEGVLADPASTADAREAAAMILEVL